MWILLNNIWIPTFFTDSLQGLSFTNNIDFIARLVGVGDIFLQNPTREFAFTAWFTAAQNQHYCQEQSTVPRNPLGHCNRRRWTNTRHVINLLAVAVFLEQDYGTCRGFIIVEKGAFLILVVGVGAILGGSWNVALSEVGVCLRDSRKTSKSRGARVGLTAFLNGIISFVWLASFYDKVNFLPQSASTCFHACACL